MMFDVKKCLFSGKMYTGVNDGRLVEIDLETGATRDLVKYFGKPPCGEYMNYEYDT